MHDTRIFRPTASHAEIIAQLGADTFAATFVGMTYYTAAIVEGYTSQAFTAEIMSAELADPKIQYFLAESKGSFVGYAKVMERELEPCIKHPNSLYVARLYLTKAAHGTGLAHRMMDEIYQEARRRDCHWLWLSVWEHNLRALAFYKKLGFERVGEWDWTFESQGVRYVDLDYLMMARVPSLKGK